MLKSIYSGAGYYRASNLVCDQFVTEEDDLLVCTHQACGQKIMKKSDWKAEGGFCHSCNAPVCSGCAALIPVQGCEVFLRRLENELERNYRRGQNARMLGI